MIFSPLLHNFKEKKANAVEFNSLIITGFIY